MTSPQRALIVVDVQNEYFDGPLEVRYPAPSDALANITAAIDAAEAHDVPVVVVTHTYPAGSPVFAENSDGWQLHPDLQARSHPGWKRVSKSVSSALAADGLAQWIRDNGVDTVSIVGFMTNNCDLATAAHAETLGLSAEVLSDATGAINLANAAGTITAEELHRTLMVLLHSNLAAVATTADWMAAVKDGNVLPKSNLVSSALDGRSGARDGS